MQLQKITTCLWFDNRVPESSLFEFTHGQSRRSEPWRWATLGSICILLLVAWFASLELRGLFIPDEGRYAEIPREMIATGDWVTPRLNDLRYFEKPPLQYWLTAVSFRFFGEDEWTARLPSAVLGLLAVLMLGFTGYRLKGACTGLLAAVILGSSWAFFLGAQYLTLDMTLTAFLTAALCAFLLAQDQEVVERRNAWMLAAWVATALAVLSKGLIGIVLPGLAIASYAVVRRDPGLLRRLNPLAGGALLLLIVAPWFIVVQYRNPEFFHFFFIHEHLERFAESAHHRAGPWWYYVPIVIAGLMPWTPALLRIRAQRWKAPIRGPRAFSVEWFAALWALVTLLFFSLSQSKLPAYVLPAFPAIALILAQGIEHRPQKTLGWSAWGMALLAGALMVSLWFLPRASKFAALGQDAQNALPWLFAASAFLLISAAAAIVLVRRAHFATAILCLALGTLGSWNLVFIFLHAVDESLSSERLIETLTQDQRPFRPEVPFFSVSQFDTSVPFYLGRPITLVATRGELAPGIDAEPHKAIASIEQFVSVWNAQTGQAYAILRPDTLAILRQRGMACHEMVSDRRLSVVSRISP